MPILPEPSQVGERIKEIRKKKNLTQKELGEFLGLEQPTIVNYEKDRIPDAEVLCKLAEIGEVTVDWILGREKPLALTPEKEYAYIRNEEKLAELAKAKLKELARPLISSWLLLQFINYLKVLDADLYEKLLDAFFVTKVGTRFAVDDNFIWLVPPEVRETEEKRRA